MGDPKPPSTVSPPPGAARSEATLAAERAFSLGWSLSELAHLGGDEGEPPDATLLKTFHELQFIDRLDVTTQHVSESMKLVLGSDDLLTARTIAADPTGAALAPGGSAALATLHADVLKAVSVSNQQLAQAYLAGVGLSEIAYLGYRALRDGGQGALLKALLEKSRVQHIYGRLRDLKSLFQPYSAAAVAATALDWSKWIDLNASGLDAPDETAAAELHRQGAIWRTLLTGERLSTDTLEVGDYINALRNLVGSYWQLGRRYVWLGLGVGIAVAGALVVILVNRSQLQAIWTPVAALLGVFGLSGAAVVAGVKRAADKAEGALWEAELGAAVAAAINHVPQPVTDSAVADLRSAPRRSEKRRVRVSRA